ncbi:MAG TPA: hypothetical protein VHY37_01250 [Tepidisphaeraceae bacterium]|jgi:hypothetical protein|nr:hypothetical protein [Tepidisphaeraceae bacterium]
MTMHNLDQPFKIGAVVRIRDSGYRRARIVEFRGPLRPKGARVYRIRVGKKPHTSYLDVLENQLEAEAATH